MAVLAPALPFIIAAATVASAGVGIASATGAFSGGGGKSSAPGMPVLQPLPIPPTDKSAEVQAAAERQRKAAGLAKGRESTLLTGGLGDTSIAPVVRKTLLGEGG